MILAAGRGTRLATLGLDIPKVLVDVGGEPLLARQLRYLGGQGVERVVVNTHHLADQVERFCASAAGIDVQTEREPTLLGTAGGVRNALDRLGEAPFLVLYGDVLVDEPLGPLLDAHRTGGGAATLAVYETTETEGKGTVATAPDGGIEAFVEKGPADGAPALVNAGVYVVEPAFVADLPRGEERDFGHDLFPAALARGERLVAYRLERPVIDVGTPEGLEAARAAVRRAAR